MRNCKKFCLCNGPVVTWAYFFQKARVATLIKGELKVIEELAKLEAERGNPEYLPDTVFGSKERNASKEIRQHYGGGGGVL